MQAENKLDFNQPASRSVVVGEDYYNHKDDETKETTESQQVAENQLSAENQENIKNKLADFTQRIELKYGYQDKEDSSIIHRDVVISRRPVGADVISILENYGGVGVQHTLGFIATSITKFGSITMPVPLTVLLSLDEIDRDELEAYNALFLVLSQGERENKILSLGKVQLAFGVEHEGISYDVVEFGKRLTGYDEIAIEAEAASNWQATFLKRARRVIKLSKSSDGQSVSTSLSYEQMEAMDFADLALLREAESQWLDSFRR